MKASYLFFGAAILSVLLGILLLVAGFHDEGANLMGWGGAVSLVFALIASANEGEWF